MEIILNEQDIANLEFRVEQTSDRQDQPLSLADSKKWPRMFDNDYSWQTMRWDMFYVEVLLPMHHLNDSVGIRTEFNGHQTYHGTGSTWLKVARIFVDPKLQDPPKFSLNRQSNALSSKSNDNVEDCVKVWFVQQRQHAQQVQWTISAMMKMREVLVLAGRFDVDWWNEFQSNIDKLKGGE